MNTNVLLYSLMHDNYIISTFQKYGYQLAMYFLFISYKIYRKQDGLTTWSVEMIKLSCNKENELVKV